jgi:hypothetical protein
MSTSLISDLESCWDWESGFFAKLRRGQWDVSALEHVLNILSAIEANDSTSSPRRVVSMLWYMPLFMSWQNEQVSESGIDRQSFELAVNRIQEQIERILGVP